LKRPRRIHTGANLEEDRVPDIQVRIKKRIMKRKNPPYEEIILFRGEEWRHEAHRNVIRGMAEQ